MAEDCTIHLLCFQNGSTRTPCFICYNATQTHFDMTPGCTSLIISILYPWSFNRLRLDLQLAQPAYKRISKFNPGTTNRKTSYLKILVEKVRLQATNAIIKIPHRALTLPQIMEFLPFVPILQVPLSSVRAPNANAKFADSKIIKKRSNKTSRILAFGDRRPNGFPVYSSQVM